MLPRSSVKPLELVISAIHCLRERKGSSPQDILKYLLGKYNVDPSSLKTHVQAGLKRGLSFGLITQKSGLYRLNDILSSPIDATVNLRRPPKPKVSKSNRAIKKQKVRKLALKKGKRSLNQHLANPFGQKGKRKGQKNKEKKKAVRKKPSGNSPKNGPKRRKQKRKKVKSEKTHKSKKENPSKVKPEKVTEATVQDTEQSETQRCSVNIKEPESVKSIVKT